MWSSRSAGRTSLPKRWASTRATPTCCCADGRRGRASIRKEELIAAVDKALDDIPGIAYNFTQPMAMRIDETISGVKADLAIKMFGDDFGTLDALGQQVLRADLGVRGAADAQMEITSGVAELSVARRSRRARALRPERHGCRRSGRGAGHRATLISEVIDGQKRYTWRCGCPSATGPIRMPCEGSSARARRRTSHVSTRWRTSK